MKDAVQNVLAVVVSYNRRELLMQCIHSLLKQDNAACDVLVVDNASTDGTGEAVNSLQNKRVSYYNTGKNLGGAGGFNVGLRLGFEKGYTYLWVMDDDTLPKSDALAALLEADRVAPEGYGYLSSVVLWTDGGECRMNRQKLKKSFYIDSPLLRYGMVLCEQATFVSLFLPAKTIGAVGLPIRDFFIWGDDIEYTRRIAVRKAMPSYLVGRSQVVHAMKDNNGSSIAKDLPERIPRYRYAYRNDHYTYRKEGVRGFAFYTAKCILNMGRILKYSKTYRFRRLGIIVGQYIAGFFFRPKVEAVTYSKESGKDL